MGNVHVETYGRSENTELDKKCEDFIPRRKYYPASCPTQYFGVDHRENHSSTHSEKWGRETSNNNNTSGRVGFDPDWEEGKYPNLKPSGRPVVQPLKTSHSFNPDTKTLRGYEDYNPFKPANAQEIESENVEHENNTVAVEWTPDFKSHYESPVPNDRERNDGRINNHSGLTPILTPSPGSASPIAVYRSGSTFIPVRTASFESGSSIGAQNQPLRAFPINYGVSHSDVEKTGVGSGPPRSSGDATPNQVGLSKQSSDAEKHRLGKNNFAAEPDVNDTRIPPVKNKTETIIPRKGSFNSGRGQSSVTSSKTTKSSTRRVNAGSEKQSNVSEPVSLGKRNSSSLISRLLQKSSSERKKDDTSMPTSVNDTGKNSDKKATPFNARKKSDSFQGHEAHPTRGPNLDPAALQPDQSLEVPQSVASINDQQINLSEKDRQAVNNPTDYSESQSDQKQISSLPVLAKPINDDQPPLANVTTLQEDQPSETIAWRQSSNAVPLSAANTATNKPAESADFHNRSDDSKSNANPAKQAVSRNEDDLPMQLKVPVKPVQLPHLHRQTKTSNDQAIYSPDGKASKADTKSSTKVVSKDIQEPPTEISGSSQTNQNNSGTPAWSTKSDILNRPASETSRAFLYNDFFDDPLMAVPSVSRRNIAQEAQQPTPVNFEPRRVSKPPTRKASLEVSRPLLPKLVKTLSSMLHPSNIRETASSIANEPVLEKTDGNISRMDSTQALFQRPWAPDKVDSNSGTASPTHRSHGQLNSNERAEKFPTRFGSVGKISPANPDNTRNDKEGSQSNSAPTKAPQQQLVYPMNSQILNSAASALQPPTVSLKSTPAAKSKEADFSAFSDKENLKGNGGIESGLPALGGAPRPLELAANIKKPVSMVTPSPRDKSKESMKQENQLEGLHIDSSDDYMAKPRIKQNLTAGRGNRTLGSDDDADYLSAGPLRLGQSETHVSLDIKNETRDSSVPIDVQTSAIVNTAIPSIGQSGNFPAPSQPKIDEDKTYPVYSNSSTKPIESTSAVGVPKSLEFFQPETYSEYHEEETVTVVRPTVYNPLTPASSWPQRTDEQQDQITKPLTSSANALTRQSSGAQLPGNLQEDRSPKSRDVLPTPLARRNDNPKDLRPKPHELWPRSGNSTDTNFTGIPSAPTISRLEVVETNGGGIEPLKAFRGLSELPASLAESTVQLPYSRTAESQHPHPKPPTEKALFSPKVKIPSAEHLKNQRPLVSGLPDVHQPNKKPLDEADKEDGSEQGKNRPLKFITTRYPKDLEDSSTSIETDTGGLPGNTHADGPDSSIELNALDKFRSTFPPYYSHQRMFIPSPVMSNRRLSRTAGEITPLPNGISAVGRTATAPPLSGSNENLQNPPSDHRRISPVYRASKPQKAKTEMEKVTLGDMITVKDASPQTHVRASSSIFPSGGDNNTVVFSRANSSLRTVLQDSANEQNPDYTSSKDLLSMKNSAQANQAHVMNLAPESIPQPYLRLSDGQLNDQPAQSDKFGALAGIPIASKTEEPFTLVGTTGGSNLRMNSLQSQSLHQDPVNMERISHVFKQGKICCIVDEGTTACSWHIGLGTTWLIFIGGVALGYFAQKHWPLCLPKAEPSANNVTSVSSQSQTPTPASFPNTNPFKLQSASHRNPACHIRP